MARAQGILLKKPRVTQNASQGQILARYQSAPLADIIRDMLKYSTNVTAEVLGLAASAQNGSTPSTLAGSGRKMASWAGPALGMKSARFTDHSGLGDQSRVPASEMVAALVAANPRGPLHSLMKDIKLKDEEGKVLKNHTAKVRAKTGTLNFVSALAGYITTADNTELAFAIFTADLDTRAKIKRDDREVPKGGRAWSRKSRRLQQKFIQRWAVLYK
jgi:D-alanyl-D-alanine carboxypeptidase/D-alanyl-D-alanine-endopeptidase (penicillin-binding protein 4)